MCVALLLSRCRTYQDIAGITSSANSWYTYTARGKVHPVYFPSSLSVTGRAIPNLVTNVTDTYIIWLIGTLSSSDILETLFTFLKSTHNLNMDLKTTKSENNEPGLVIHNRYIIFRFCAKVWQNTQLKFYSGRTQNFHSFTYDLSHHRNRK